MKRLIAILAKEPSPGRVKTRLAEGVGAEQAAGFAEAFLVDTIQTAAQVPGADVLLSFDPPGSKAWFQAHAPAGCHFQPQPQGGLGERIQSVFDWGFAQGASACVAIGMDTPQLSSAQLADALDACTNGSVVIGPSSDGGYYLIGMDRPRPALFNDVAWSTDSVLRQTLAHVEACGARAVQHSEEHDVDDLQGLEALDAARLGPLSRAALLAFRRARKG